MHKLTLSVDAGVVSRAKQYARSRRTSVSRLVETYLGLLGRAPESQSRAAVDAKTPPVLARLRGSLRRGSVADHRRYLSRKHR